LGKGMNGFIESNDLHLRNELFHLPKVIFDLLAIIRTKDKLCKDDLGNIAVVFVLSR
jgi:hypothetical protein